MHELPANLPAAPQPPCATHCDYGAGLRRASGDVSACLARREQEVPQCARRRQRRRQLRHAADALCQARGRRVWVDRQVRLRHQPDQPLLQARHPPLVQPVRTQPRHANRHTSKRDHHRGGEVLAAAQVRLAEPERRLQCFQCPSKHAQAARGTTAKQVRSEKRM